MSIQTQLPAQASGAMEPTSSASASSMRATKRKLQDAIQSLDVAVAQPPSASVIDRPTPSKRPHLTRSLYSTLAKYGVKSRKDPKPSPDAEKIDVSKSAPHLAAILARSASRSKQALSLKHPSAPPAHSASEYRPSSTQSFLSRIATYKITTYTNKPPQIDAVAAAKCGWINDGKDRLVCGVCDVSWILAGREGMNRDAANALVEKQRVSLVEMHKDGCPWKTRQCDSSIYRVPLQSPAAMVRELRTTALLLEPMVANVAVKHPLTPLQLSSLRSILSAASTESPIPEDHSAMEVDGNTQPTTLSDTAIVTTLFGWSPAPSPSLNERRRTSSMSASCAGSYGPSASMPPTPSLSRASSVSRLFRDRESTPTLSTSPRMSISQFSVSPVRARTSSREAWPNSISSTGTIRDTSLLHCVLCQRRVGLWGYSTTTTEAQTPSAQDEHSPPVSHQPQKQFDLVKEHRSYCPYIVCSTAVPSFPSSSTQRQRLSRLIPNDDDGSQSRDAELQGVEAMLAGVKSNGGRELLRYVKGLLG
ncbi:zf-C3HC-domain-containing protein [Melanogaster broomeanus]|nr:zf-C3HC-domain-containing protein [Melanogaster broomeanus]